jgi:hypothetical protein
MGKISIGNWTAAVYGYSKHDIIDKALKIGLEKGLWVLLPNGTYQLVEQSKK